MNDLVKPYASESLHSCLLEGDELTQAVEYAETLNKITLSSRELSDLVMLGIGAMNPLTGFMSHDDWRSVCENMTLADGTFWPVPVTLSIVDQLASQLQVGNDYALQAKNGALMGILHLEEKYTCDKKFECEQIYQTYDEKHPGVIVSMQQGNTNLSGTVKVLSEGEFPSRYVGLYMTPQQTRNSFIQREWKNVAAFQTRNPMHRAHEYLVKVALEICDGVLIHSVLGEVKQDDIPPVIATMAIRRLVQKYFVKERIIQSGVPLEMRYAGPREALLHAIIRQNYGCNYLIVGRDHAGANGYYEPFAAQHIFDQVPAGALQIQALKLDWAFWCIQCDGMATGRTCPHEDLARIKLSGTALREALRRDESVPEHFSRVEVLEILQAYYCDR